MMKKMILIFSALFAFNTFGQEEQINWMSLDEGIKQAKEQNKYILVDVYATWCKPCKKMDEVTYSNPDVIAVVNEYFIPIKVDGDSKETVTYLGKEYQITNLVTAEWKVESYPNAVYLDEKAEHMANLRGFREPLEFRLVTEYIGSKAFVDISLKEFIKQKTGN